MTKPLRGAWLPVSLDAVREVAEVRFLERDADGLDAMTVLHLTVAGHQFEAFQHDGTPDVVELGRATEPGALALATAVGAPLLMPGDPFPKWRVMRQDDNGSTFLMEVVEDKATADQIVADFEAKGHKQTYWVEVIHPVQA